jgi:Ca2+-transporting ATPase
VAAIAQCQAAGIRVVMITGDHPSTAAAIAHQLKILPDGDAAMLTGAALDALPDATRGDVVDTMRVFARAAPEQKIRIVEALQAHGHYVAMTGDGVNDAPALRRANIGVAMGLGGTDVAREAAHLVLLDDNFSTIVSAVREGRRVYDNLRRFIRYTLACNSGEVLTVFLAPLMGLPVPFLPIHILWINLVTDGLPSLALAAEPAERGVMERPPRPPTESIFAHGLWQHVVWVGFLLATVTLSVQGWAYTTGDAHWQSMTFTVLALSQMGHVMAVRSERDSLFTMGLMTNRPLLGAVVLSVALQLSTLYIPVLQRVFHTAPLSLPELAVCLACSCALLGAVEIEKLLIRRGVLYAAPTPVAAAATLDA